MSIKIGVQAEFDSQAITAELNKLGKSIAQANKTKFEPIPAGAVKNMDELEKRFQKLLQLNREMSRRITVSGQKGSSFLDLDWGKLYENERTKSAKMAQAFSFVTGAGFSRPSGGGQRQSGGFADESRRIGWNATEAGLRAAGPATGGMTNVAAGAVNRGMSAGFGAGLMGLLGGALALGVSKIVGSISEKLDEAEANAIANDRLKRVLGDVTVSFGVLKETVRATADQTHVLYSEAAQLTTQFAKQGNLKSNDYRTIAGETGVGIGMARSLGIDPAQGVGPLATMRGLRITNNDQETRRMALLIGETIGKSDAFAKSTEVMQALTGFAARQTSLAMSAANVSGYAGLYSSMVGTGYAGFDPANSASILGRVISTLQQGGGAGEASQFFSSRIAEQNGLNPIAGSIWRESPLSSVGEAFGPDTAVGRYLSKRGVSLPGGNGGSFYAQTLEQMKRQYSDPWMLLNASSRHLGISNGQAAAMLDLNPNQMGELEGRLGKDFDLSKLRGEAITSMSKILGADEGQLKSVADDLRSRIGTDELSKDEVDRLNSAMSSGDINKMKDTLLALTASRGQEQTQGKDIHDSKVALDNMKTLMADQLIPLTQDMRAGILYLAGKDDGMAGVDVLKKIAETESQSRTKRIDRHAEADKSRVRKEFVKNLESIWLDERYASPTTLRSDEYQTYQEKLRNGTATASDREELLSDIRRRHKAGGSLFTLNKEGRGKLADLYEQRQQGLDNIASEREKALEKEQERLKAEKLRIDKADEVRYQIEDGVDPQGNTGGKSKYGSSMKNSFGLRAAVAQAERRIGAPEGFLWAQMGVESNYNPNAVSKAGAMGLAQVMPSTLRALEKRFDKKLDPYNPRDAVFIMEKLMSENYSRFKNWEDAARAYNGGWNPSTWGNPETSAYVPKIRERQRNGTQIDDPHFRSDNEHRFILDAPPIEVVHRNERGQQVMPSQSLTPTLRPASPFGTTRYS